jgi:thiol-disulfide isomerase/thioredoxin
MTSVKGLTIRRPADRAIALRVMAARAIAARAIAARAIRVVRAGAVLCGLFVAGPVLAADPPALQGASTPLVWVGEKVPAPAVSFSGVDGTPKTLADFSGRVVLLNLWATWCAPCVKEMPALDRLQASFADSPFTVVALSVDRQGLAAVQPFFTKAGIKHLPVYVDNGGKNMGTLAPRGLPTSWLIGRDGSVLARLEGEAEWDSPAALAVIRYALALPAS